jgi:hypothetical protein
VLFCEKFEMFVTWNKMWGSRLIDTLEDKRRSCENSEESKKRSLCARTLGKHVPENRLNYVQSVEMTGLNA